MKREDIIRMAQDAGFDPHDMSDDFTCNLINIERFAELVRADEREACAKVCEEQRDLREEARAALRVSGAFKEGDGDTMLRAMRHESNVRLYHAGIDKCAAAIRARGQA